MERPDVEGAGPSRARMIVATIIVALVVLGVWAVIEQRQQPPPPPHKIGERVEVNRRP